MRLAGAKVSCGKIQTVSELTDLQRNAAMRCDPPAPNSVEGFKSVLKLYLLLEIMSSNYIFKLYQIMFRNCTPFNTNNNTKMESWQWKAKLGQQTLVRIQL